MEDGTVGCDGRAEGGGGGMVVGLEKEVWGMEGEEELEARSSCLGARLVCGVGSGGAPEKEGRGHGMKVRARYNTRNIELFLRKWD